MHATESRHIDFPAPTDARRIARVIRARDGHALQVESGGAEWPVAAHLDSVSPLACGDKVLVESVPDGVVILGRLRGADEPPALPVRQDAEGRLLIDHARGVILRARGNAIELRADGAVLVNGNTIQAAARGLHRLQGATIELN